MVQDSNKFKMNAAMLGLDSKPIILDNVKNKKKAKERQNR